MLSDLSKCQSLLCCILPGLYLEPVTGILSDLLKLIEDEQAKLIILGDSSKISSYEIAGEYKCKLREYQREGISRLAFPNRFCMNGILNNDMSLGKIVHISHSNRNKNTDSEVALVFF